MAIKNHRVWRYQYEFRNIAGRDDPDTTALVYLYGSRNSLFAALAFVNDKAKQRNPEEQESGVVTASYPMTMLNNVIDMLRHEKPIVFCWDPEAGELGFTTGSEPIGEQEVKRLFSFLYL